MQNRNTAVCLTFDDAANPLADPVGFGSTLLMPKGALAVVNDATRGNVLSFTGGKCLKGPLTDGGLPAFVPIAGSHPYTAAFWIKPDAACDTKAKLIFWGTNQDGQAMALRFNGKSGFMMTPWGSNQEISTADLFDGAWHHLAVTFDGVEYFKVYVDGTNVKTFNVKGCSHPNVNFYVGSVWGGWVTTGANPYTGLMDDLLVTTYALAPDQIQAIRTYGLTACGKPAGVAASAGGIVSLPEGKATVGTLSGSGVLGGVEVRGDSLTVGTETAATNVYKAQLFGSDAALVKEGADNVLTLEGRARNITNVTVKAGRLTVKRPLLRKGLVASYSFEDADDLGFDDSASSFGLTAVGTPTQVAGKVGKALHLDGNSYLSSSGALVPAGLTRDSSRTVSLWVRPTAASNGILASWGSDAEYQAMILRQNGAASVKFSNWNMDMEATTSGLTDGAWHHVVVTYDAATKKKVVYYDGVSVGTSTVWRALETTAAGLFVGWASYDNAVKFTGDIDELAIYNVAWTADEVKAAFADEAPEAVAAEEVLPPALAHWSFDGADASGDDSGNGYALVGTMPELVTDPFVRGKAAKFTGSESLTLSDFPASFPTGNVPFSVCCRFRAETTMNPPAYPTLVMWGGGDWTKGELVKLGTGKDQSGGFADAGGARFTAGGFVYSTDTTRSQMGTDRLRWRTATITYNGIDSQLKFYVDGVLVLDQRNLSMNIKSGGFAIGTAFKGLIDDIRIYGETLSAGQVDTLARALTPEVSDFTVLPREPDVSVAADATLTFDAIETVRTIAGGGSLAIAKNGQLTVKGNSTFAGDLSGLGEIALAPRTKIQFTKGVTNFKGRFTALPQGNDKGRIVVGSDGSVTWTSRLGLVIILR